MKNKKKLNINIGSDKGLIFLLCFLVLMLISTVKYITHGERYSFTVPATENYVELNNKTISQTIVVDKYADWHNRSFAVYLTGISTAAEKEGYLHTELFQDNTLVSSCDIPANRLAEGYFALQHLDFKKLHYGNALLTIEGCDLDFALLTSLADNYYNFPNCIVDGNDTGYALSAQYQIHFTNSVYKTSIALFIILIVISAVSLWCCAVQSEEIKCGYMGILRFNLILSYLILVYIYNKELYFEPTWAEAVTNFMSNSNTKSILENLFITDAGYLPLAQRLIAIFCFKILPVSSYSGLYLIQFTAYIISGAVFSFFIKSNFSQIISKEYRYALCLLLMVLTIDMETGAFINFMTYGILIFFLYFLAGSKSWSRTEFIFICIWSSLCCLSKGVYVTLLPVIIVCGILFARNFTKRDWILCGCTAASALIQLIYYFQYGSSNINWLDRTGAASGEYYFLKLVLKLFVDTPNSIFAVFSNNVNLFNGLSFIIIPLFWIIFIYWFIKGVAIKFIRREKVSGELQTIFTILIFIMAQTMFYRITVYGVDSADILSDEFWMFQVMSIVDRYNVLTFLAVFVLIIVFLKICRNKDKTFFVKTISILTVCVAASCGRMQIKGLGNDNYSTLSTFSSASSEAVLMKNIENVSCRFIPINPNGWIYSKGAVCNSFGVNINQWSAVPMGGSVYTGILELSAYENINRQAAIYQIFITKNCLLNNSRYQAVLYDDAGNILATKSQDNSIYRKRTSFSFDDGIRNVGKIQILDEYGNTVYIEDSMYIITSDAEQFIMG